MEIQEAQVGDKVYKFKGKYLSRMQTINGLGQTFTYRLYRTPRGYRVHIDGYKLTYQMPEWWARFWYAALFTKAGLIKEIDLK